MLVTPTCVALIPARAGSKRIPRKNIRELAGHPLLAYAIAAARASGVFALVVVSTDSEEYAAIAERYGAEVIMRPPEMATDLSPDFEWVRHALGCMSGMDAFSILRPTSPFRSAATIRRAWTEFVSQTHCDSLRAMESARQHPGKMWLHRLGDEWAMPFWRMVEERTGQPYHSSPTQALPTVLVQNASLEIAWVRTVERCGNISGEYVYPFRTEGYEGLDLNTPEDLILAEALLAAGRATLPAVTVPAGA